MGSDATHHETDMTLSVCRKLTRSSIGTENIWRSSTPWPNRTKLQRARSSAGKIKGLMRCRSRGRTDKWRGQIKPTGQRNELRRGPTMMSWVGLTQIVSGFFGPVCHPKVVTRRRKMRLFGVTRGEDTFSATRPYPAFCDSGGFRAISAKPKVAYYESSALPLSYPGG
jgi:hypothetical protein